MSTSISRSARRGILAPWQATKSRRCSECGEWELGASLGRVWRNPAPATPGLVAHAVVGELHDNLRPPDRGLPINQPLSSRRMQIVTYDTDSRQLIDVIGEREQIRDRPKRLP